MKTIKKVSAKDRQIIFLIVNSPTGGTPALDKAQVKERKPLFNKIISDGIDNGRGFDFSGCGDKNIVLEDDEWFQLVECFHHTFYPSMYDEREANRIETYIKSA